jgi:hypothetical protein
MQMDGSTHLKTVEQVLIICVFQPS